MNSPRRNLSSRFGIAAGAMSILLLLGGCAAGVGVGGQTSAPSETSIDAEATPGDDAGVSNAMPQSQEESCGWDASRLSTGVPDVPKSGDVELQSSIVGAWQHTHFDTGSGYEAVSHDIRYVFPSSDRLLYCQHVPGVTEYAENAADVTWDNTRIVIGGSTPRFEVLSWNATTMIWLNLADDSHYLLQRR
jgi:hypothetical protein